MLEALDKRRKKLLQILLSKEEKTSIGELAEELAISGRTVRSDLNNLSSHLGELEGVEIIRKRGVGVWLEADEERRKILMKEFSNHKDNYQSLSPEKRRQLILKYLLQVDERTTIQELADELYVSRTTVFKDLDKVEEWLSRYNLNLERKRRYGIRVLGDEKDWRKAVADLLAKFKDNKELRKMLEEAEEERLEGRIDNKNYRELKNLFDDINFRKIEDIIAAAEKKADFLFTDETFIGLVVHIAISLERLRHGKDIEMDREQLEKLQSKNEYEIAKMIAGELEEEMDISIPQEEIGYISLHILGAKFQNDIELRNIEDVLEEADPKVIEISREIINTASKVLEIDLSKDEKLLPGLILHLRAAVNRLEYGLSLRNPMLEEIKENYPQVFGAAWMSNMIFEKHLGAQVNEDGIGYIALHLGAARERLKEKKKALVVCSSGLGTAQFLAARLKKRLSGIQVEDIVSVHKLEEKDLSSIDVIVSTIPLQKNYSVPVINISSLGTEEDIEMIQRKLSTIKESDSRPLFEETVENLENIEDLIKKETIYLDLEAESREEVIEFLGEKLLERGLVKPGFIESVFEREELTTTEAAKGIALPHGEKEYVLSPRVVIAKLADSVFWSESQTEFVFMLAFTCREEAEIFFKRYLQIIEDKHFLNKMRNADTCEEIRQLFLRKNYEIGEIG